MIWKDCPVRCLAAGTTSTRWRSKARTETTQILGRESACETADHRPHVDAAAEGARGEKGHEEMKLPWTQQPAPPASAPFLDLAAAEREFREKFEIGRTESGSLAVRGGGGWR